MEIANNNDMLTLEATTSLLRFVYLSILSRRNAQSPLSRELDHFATLIEYHLYVPSDIFAQEEAHRESNLLEYEERLNIALQIWKACLILSLLFTWTHVTLALQVSVQVKAQGMSRQYSANSTSPDSPFASCPDDLLLRWSPTQMAHYVAGLSFERSSTEPEPIHNGYTNQHGKAPAPTLDTLVIACSTLSLESTTMSSGSNSPPLFRDSMSNSSEFRATSPAVSVSFSDFDSDNDDEGISTYDLDSRRIEDPQWNGKTLLSPLKSCLKSELESVPLVGVLTPPRRIVERWTKDDWAQYHSVLNTMIRYTSSEGVYVSSSKNLDEVYLFAFPYMLVAKSLCRPESLRDICGEIERGPISC